MDWIWIIVALLIGLAVGGAAAYLMMKRRFGDRESVAELRSEYDRYRGRVTEHFVETADLVNTLTRSYKRVYDHLEEGAYELVGEDTLRRRLDAPNEEPVLIEYLGRRRSPEPGGVDEGTAASAGAGARTRPGASATDRSETALAAGSTVGSSVGVRDARQEASAAGPEARLERDVASDGAGATSGREGELPPAARGAARARQDEPAARRPGAERGADAAERDPSDDGSDARTAEDDASDSEERTGSAG